eukprot:747686-Hanusia_phi.AAC.2
MSDSASGEHNNRRWKVRHSANEALHSGSERTALFASRFFQEKNNPRQAHTRSIFHVSAWKVAIFHPFARDSRHRLTFWKNMALPKGHLSSPLVPPAGLLPPTPLDLGMSC